MLKAYNAGFIKGFPLNYLRIFMQDYARFEKHFRHDFRQTCDLFPVQEDPSHEVASHQ